MKNLARLVSAIAAVSFLSACGAADDPAAPAQAEQAPPAASAADPSMASAPAMPGDPITALCVSYGDAPAPCECATAKFRTSDPDANLYAEIAANYLADEDGDKSTVDRWEDAEQKALAEHQRTGEKRELNVRFGRGHRDAIKSCLS